MAFIARAGWLVGVILLGLEALGCGAVAESATDGNNGLPTSTDRFAFAKSGDRVQALGYVSQGATQFRTLHDQQLDFDCEFASAKICADLRCFPKRTAQLIFLDADCSELAGWIDFRPAHVGDWVTSGRASSDCPGQGVQREVFEIGEEVSPEASIGTGPPVYEWRDTRCVAASPPAKSLPAVYRLIAHANSELVAAKTASFDAGGGLRLSRVLGEDGSELTVAVTNAAGQVCWVGSDGECVPLGEDATGAFPTTQRIRQGSGAAHIDLFTSSPGAGRVGVPVDHFPEVLDFVDDAGYRCEVVSAVDGTLRCLPLYSTVPAGSGGSAYESGNYSDPGCMQRLHYGYPTGVDPSFLRVALYTDSRQLTAVSTLKVYAGPVFAFDNQVCVSAVSNRELLTLDHRIDASALPEVFETAL